MSAGPPNVPPPGQPPQGPPGPPPYTPSGPPPKRGAGPMLIGIFGGLGVLILVLVLTLFVLGPCFPEAWLFGLPLFLIAYLVVGVVLAVRPRTSLLGGGLLIGLGAFVLLGGGACFGLFFFTVGATA